MGNASAAEGSPDSVGKVELVYWPIRAKNMASALALELGGFDWDMGAGPGSKGTGDLWAEWLEIKPDCTWKFLPNLVLPGGARIGSELAVLQFLARKSKLLAGSSDKDFMISQELLHQSEELYQKISSKVPTIMAKDKSPEEFEKFMAGADQMAHSKEYGLQVYLAQFDEFYTKCGGSGGCFTSSGETIGECKLFATLHLLPPLQSSEVFAKCTNVALFYESFAMKAKVKAVMEKHIDNKPQYFIQPPSVANQ